jgi:hypothetical protein
MTKRIEFVFFSAALAIAIIFSPGCKTDQEKAPPTAAEIEAKRVEKEQRRIERDKQRDKEREEEDEQRAKEQRQEASEQLRRKFARYTTAELKIMRARYAQYAEMSGSGRDVNVNVNRRRKQEYDLENTERVIEIERELIRRWKAGDEEAKLPEFGNGTPSPGK